MKFYSLKYCLKLIFGISSLFFIFVTCNVYSENLAISEEISSDSFKLGKPLGSPNLSNSFRFQRRVPQDNTGGWSIDTNNRQLVRQFYNSVYKASENTPIEWTGDHIGCNEGATSDGYKNSVLARINYYRAVVGIPANISLNQIYNQKSQQAALMMSINDDLEHFPPDTWNCYSADGAEAASNSNIALGPNFHGARAIDGYIEDAGPFNTHIGHRRWIFYPQTQEMGTGDIAKTENYNASNALWVFDGNFGSPRPTTRDNYVAWPVPGYNPYQLIPARWSFSYPGASFLQASVSMQKDGTDVSVSIRSRTANIGESTIVWIPNNLSTLRSLDWPKPISDEEYIITVSNVFIDGIATDFTYSVKIIDNNTALENEQSPIVSGNTNIIANTVSAFQFSPVSYAKEYETLFAEITISNDNFDAESQSTALIDNTDPSYELLYQGIGTGGNISSVYKLSPVTAYESFELEPLYIPSITSELTFKSKLGVSTENQTASIQISRDNGTNWNNIFTQIGSESLNVEADPDFVSRNISLAEYSNELVRFRIVYEFSSGLHYTGDTAGVSFLIDDFFISNAKKIESQEIINTGLNTSFDVTPESNKEYVLSARSILWEGYPGGEWSDLLFVSSGEQVEIDSSLDIDDDDKILPLTDGLLVLRYLFGFRDESLTNNAIDSFANRTTASDIQLHIDSIIGNEELDIDGDGEVKALTDGIILLRYLFGLRGNSLIQNALGDGATRNTAENIETYIKQLLPM